MVTMIVEEVSVSPKVVNPFWDEAMVFLGPKMFGEGYELTWDASNWDVRRSLCRKYAWAVPDPDSLTFVAKHLGDRAIEIGAGTGYWAWQLSQLGVAILAYDVAPPDKEKNNYHAVFDEQYHRKDFVPTWHPVARGDHRMLHRYPGRTLLLCWPPMEPMASLCLAAYRGNRLVFIGEQCGGCTGDDAFFECLEAEWRLVAMHPIVQWWGIHDHIMVYERRKKRVIIEAKPRLRSTRRMQVAHRRHIAGGDVLRRREMPREAMSFPVAALPLWHLHAMIRMYQGLLDRLPINFDPGYTSTDGGETWERGTVTRDDLENQCRYALDILCQELQHCQGGQ